MSELLPWLFLCDDNRTVVNKDSSLMAVFQLSGVDAEAGDEHALENAAMQMDVALRLLGANGARVWTRCDRIPAQGYPEAEFHNPMAAEIDDLWRASFSVNAWDNLYTLCISMPTQRAQRTVAEMARDHIDDGLPVWQALSVSVFQKLRGTPSDQIGFSTRAELDNAMARFDQNILGPLRQQMHSFKLRRLESQELLGYLRFCSSASDPAPLATNEFEYLDAACSDTWIDNRHRDHLVLEGRNRQYAAVLTLKSAPPSNRLAALDVLMALPVRITIANCWRSVTKAKAISTLKDARTFDELRQMDLKSMLRGIMKGEGELVSSDNDPSTEVGKAAMLFVNGVKNGTDAWGSLATSIIVRAESLEALDTAVERVQHSLEQAQLNFLREREGALCGFAVGLIGSANGPVRWSNAEASNLTDLAPTITLDPGDDFHKHFSRLAGKEVPAHLTARSRYSTPSHINYHVDEVGHTLYVGPTSAGKTLQKLLMTSQGFKYPNFRAIIFDKDLSCQAATLLHDGEWIPMSEGDEFANEMMRMNPLAYITRPGGVTWAVNWIDRLAAHRGERLTERELEAVNSALDRLHQLYKQSDVVPRLTSLVTQLSTPELKDRLSIWCQGGAYGKYFDNDVDELTFSNVTCFEVGGLITMGLTDVLRAFTDYVFFRVELMVNSVGSPADIGPTEIYFEEAGFLLEDPIFTERAVDYLMTLRKKHGYLVMTAQSPEPFMRSERLRAAIRDNVSTVVFLPNANATRGDLPAMYTRAFGVNQNHLELIRDAKPKKEYCIWHPQTGEFRVSVVSIPPEITARLMSNKSSKAILKETWMPDDSTWKKRYIDRVIKEVLS